MALVQSLQWLGSLAAGIMVAGVALYCIVWLAAIPFQAAQMAVRDWRIGSTAKP